MTTPNTPAAADPIQAAVGEFIGTLNQATAPQQVQLAVLDLQRRYGNDAMAIILYEAGRTIGAAQQSWARLGSLWHQGVHSLGLSPGAVVARAQQLSAMPADTQGAIQA